MGKRLLVIIPILFISLFFMEAKADPGEQAINQLRRNYYLKVFTGEWHYTAAVGLNHFNAENRAAANFFKQFGFTGSLSMHRDINENFAGRAKISVNRLTKFQLLGIDAANEELVYNKYYPFWTASASVDLMYNLKNLIQPYEVDNTLKYWLFIGTGVYHSFAESSRITKVEYIEKKEKPEVLELEVRKGTFKLSPILPMMNLGAIVQVPLTLNLDLNIELKGVIVPQNFDNEIGGNKTIMNNVEGYAALLFGVTYHL